MVGFKGKDEPRGIYSMAPGKDPVALSDKIGMLDGLYQMKDGDLLTTDWVSWIAVAVEQDGWDAEARDRFQGSGRFLRSCPTAKVCWWSCPIWSRASCASCSSATD